MALRVKSIEKASEDLFFSLEERPSGDIRLCCENSDGRKEHLVTITADGCLVRSRFVGLKGIQTSGSQRKIIEIEG